ncbi:Pol polyprotein [Plakobranchus ocellatus]|uniref:Pol polyprotein n=1 Tax=Plakobranchus ocellatus TaxID=259542 RepID=A0AAV3YPK7_9GAST|nr:Pol polyprotein [Plakobranchus ocellatus]
MQKPICIRTSVVLRVRAHKRKKTVVRENSPDKKDFKSEFQDVFERLGYLQRKYLYHTEVEPNVTPSHNQARIEKCLIALKDRVKEELNRIEKMRVIKRQKVYTDWATASPMVVDIKANKTLRLCMDPK